VELTPPDDGDWVLVIEDAGRGWSLPTPEWRSLFDGKATAAWRSFRGTEFPRSGWVVEEGALRKMANVRGGDLVTVDEFDDFELEWEWRLGPGGNNGVKYFIVEERGGAIGHEYQLIDDELVNAEKHRTGSLYDVLPPLQGRPAPRMRDWNRSRIVVAGNHVEHWLNGELVLGYELGSPTVLEGVKASKFRDVAGFGTKLRGRIVLTDHGSEAWFRNIRVR
jgi:hypothetical protein